MGGEYLRFMVELAGFEVLLGYSFIFFFIILFSIFFVFGVIMGFIDGRVI